MKHIKSNDARMDLETTLITMFLNVKNPVLNRNDFSRSYNVYNVHENVFYDPLFRFNLCLTLTLRCLRTQQAYFYIVSLNTMLMPASATEHDVCRSSASCSAKDNSGKLKIWTRNSVKCNSSQETPLSSFRASHDPSLPRTVTAKHNSKPPKRNQDFKCELLY